MKERNLRHFESSMHAQTHTHTHAETHSVFIQQPGLKSHNLLPRAFSARVHAEQLDAMRAPVEAHSRVEDQRPHVWDEELLRLVLLHVFELELRELLFMQERKMKDDVRETLADGEKTLPPPPTTICDF